MSSLWAEDNGFRLVTGFISAISGGEARVTAPSFDQGFNEFGPCSYPAGAAEGDACLVAFDENNQAWIVGAGQGGGALGGLVTDLGGTVEALEDDVSALSALLTGQLAGYSIRAGEHTTGSLAAGNNVVVVTVPTWPTEFRAFVAYPQPLSSAFTITSHYGGVVSGSLTQGFLHMVTTGAAQAFRISWIAVGK